MTQGAVGTSTLMRLGMRRDRIVMPVWVYVLIISAISTAYSFKHLFPTEEQRRTFASGVGDVGLVSLYGKLTSDSVGGLTVWRLGVIGVALMGLMGMMTVVRHTRAEEETGRLELLGATVVGRYAPLTAAVVTALTASLVISFVVAVGLIALGLPAAGSLSYALMLLTGGWVFTGVGAIAAQLTESARAANGIAAIVLGAAYLLRAMAETSGPAWLVWTSPIGWAQRIRPFAGDRWWISGLGIAATVVLVAVAFLLVERRDIGAGLLPSRLGAAEAGPDLSGTFGLAWRLHRGTLLAWTIGFVIFGAVFGSAAQGAESMLTGSKALQDAITKMGGGQDLVDAFLASIMGVVGLIAAIYAVQATLRLRSEEAAQRAEPLLATPVTRWRWAAGHLFFAAVGSAILMAAAGLGAGLVHGGQTHDLGTQLPRLMEGALVQIPAVWVIAAIAMALFGLAPRWSQASWAALVICMLLGQFGPLLHLEQVVMDISPFSHVPKIPGGSLHAAPMLWLGLAVLLAGAAGFAGLRRRDIG